MNERTGIQHNRRSIRLTGYDYAAPGGYFLTLCAKDRKCLFGRIIEGKVVLDQYGIIVQEEWNKSAEIRREIELGPFVIMPNHVHGIVFITRDAHDARDTYVGATGRSPLRRGIITPRSPLCHGIVTSRSALQSDATQLRPIMNENRRPTGPAPRSLAAFIAGFKGSSAKRINMLRNTPGCPVWQRNYYEHVIRDQGELDRIIRYIEKNVPLEKRSRISILRKHGSTAVKKAPNVHSGAARAAGGGRFPGCHRGRLRGMRAFRRRDGKCGGDVFACRHDLLRAARMPMMRALADRLAKAEEEAADVRNPGFFMAGVMVGIKIAKLPSSDRLR